MKELKLTEDELEAIKIALSELVVQDRTGQLGIMHGANRFVSLHICLKKQHRTIFNSAYRKLGISNGVKVVNV
ncbi:hypothetical protein [Kangiella sp. HZ709]|uniref:hypothetical protein n=1 Tax=Kangiella sp. HZ709 TaxID=2666328 RepID=UPI0012AEEF8A|nr:hypothetical protein [Kangiella sp. HZ709]MRX27922.1 hypothetical protein [Kangiella sp. HZ709]